MVYSVYDTFTRGKKKEQISRERFHCSRIRFTAVDAMGHIYQARHEQMDLLNIKAFD